MTNAKGNALGAETQGASENIKSATTDKTKHKPSRKKPQPKGRRQHQRSRKFARGIAASEFGGHRRFVWSQWADFRDRAPSETPKRGDVM